MKLPKKNITELFTTYVLEPTIIDIFVEGDSDKLFIEATSAKSPFVSIYPIEHIDLEVADPIKNNKESVITLIKKLNSINTKNIMSYLGLVDRDEIPPEGEIEIDNLLVTDYSCIESHFFTKDAFTFLISKSTFAHKVNIDELYEDCSTILNFLFLAKLANIKLMYNLSWVNFLKSISFSASRFSINEEDFLKRYVNTQDRDNKIKAIEDLISKERVKITNEIRFSAINGHHLTELLYFIYSRIGKADDLKSTKTVLSMLRMIENNTLLESTTLARIKERVALKIAS